MVAYSIVVCYNVRIIHTVLFNKNIDAYIYTNTRGPTKKKMLPCLGCDKLFLTTPSTRFCINCRDIKRRIKISMDLPSCPQTRKH